MIGPGRNQKLILCSNFQPQIFISLHIDKTVSFLLILGVNSCQYLEKQKGWAAWTFLDWPQSWKSRLSLLLNQRPQRAQTWDIMVSYEANNCASIVSFQDGHFCVFSVSDWLHMEWPPWKDSFDRIAMLLKQSWQESMRWLIWQNNSWHICDMTARTWQPGHDSQDMIARTW